MGEASTINLAIVYNAAFIRSLHKGVLTSIRAMEWPLKVEVMICRGVDLFGMLPRIGIHASINLNCRDRDVLYPTINFNEKLNFRG
jgi:hypothetical protein